MSKITPNLKSEVTRQSDVTSLPHRNNYDNYANAINDNQDQITALSTSTTNNETVIARGADHASLNDRLSSMWEGQANYLKYGGVVSINGGDAQKVDVTAGEARVEGADIIWSGDTSETIPFTSANTRFDVVVVNSATTTGGQHLEIVRGAESATPVLPTIAESQKALWVLTIATASVTLSWDARDQGCRFFKEGRWQYKFLIQEAIDALSTGGNIHIGRGTYQENITPSAGVNLNFDSTVAIYNSSGTLQGTVDNVKILGEIIAVHPEVKTAFLPNDYEYAPCDGVALLPTTVFDIGNDTNVPDLTDDRFLMGDTTYSTGGNNLGHTHQWGFQRGESLSFPGLSSFNSRDSSITIDITPSASTREVAGILLNATSGGGTKFLTTVISSSSEWTHYTAGPADDSNNLMDNRPEYFSVLYYIRIR